MQDDIKLLLLKLVKSNANIQPVIELGYDYAQVISFLNLLVEQNLLQKQNNQVFVTIEGLTEIEKLNIKFNRFNSSKWIEPESESRISKIDKEFVFLPNKNELSF